MLVAILAIFALTGWTIYSEGLTYQDIKQIVKKIEDDPTTSFGEFLTIAKQQSKDLSTSLYEQLIVFVKEKYETISGSSSDQKKVTANAKPEDQAPASDPSSNSHE
jgi:hypothetical protein